MKMPTKIELNDWLALSNYDLGVRTMAWHIGEQAEELGIQVTNIPQFVAENIVFQTLAMKPETAKQAALVEALRRAAANDFDSAGRFMREYLTEQIVKVAALDEAVTGKRRQRAVSKKPRPKKGPTHRSIAIAAMQTWRRNDQSLDDFMNAANNGSVDGLTIQAAGTRGVEKYDVDCDAMTEPKRVSLRTLQEWWGESGAD